jgi:hypothetical protein
VRTLERVLDSGSSSNRLLRAALAGITVVVALGADVAHLLFVYPFGVDLEIPLRAAERWRSGGEPYLASAFLSDPGATQPFLYPPYVLPPLSLLVDLPRGLVLGAWFLVCVAGFLFICRRLAFPAWTWPLIALWPPILEPLIGGNVQLPVVALFCAVFWRSAGSSARIAASAYAPVERDLADLEQVGLRHGLMAATSAAIKVSQPQTWLALLRRQPRVAILGAIPLVIVGLVTLPVAGIATWGDWLAQLRRATDPAWELGGIAIARLVNPSLGFLASIAALVAIVAFVPRQRPGAWVGVLAVIGASSLHSFGLLFLIPAMLIIRRELAFVAAILIATTTYEGMWAGMIVITVSMVAGLRWPAWYEPGASGIVESRHRALS